MEAGAHWIPIRPKQQRVNVFKVREFVRLANRALDQRQGQFDVVQGFGFTLTRPHQVSVAQFVHDAWGRSPVHTFHVRKDLYGLYQWVYTTPEHALGAAGVSGRPKRWSPVPTRAPGTLQIGVSG